MTATLKLSNNAIGHLSAPISSSETSISLLPGEGIKFPLLAAGDWFPATLVATDGTNEIVRVTARATDVLTIVRGQEGKMPLAFLSGAVIECRLTAGALLGEFSRLGGLAASAQQAADDAAAAAAEASDGGSTLRTDLLDTGGAARIGTANGNSMQQNLARQPARYGRASGADLPAFMARLRSYQTNLAPVIPIVGFGSSVGAGATLVSPAVDAPVAWFKSQLKARLDPGNLYNIQASNYSVNGSTASEFPAAWAAMLGAGVSGPGIAVFAYGMNDQAPPIFNAGQTFPGFCAALRMAVATVKKAGWDAVLITTPHPSIVLHPEQHSMPAGIAQSYPTAVAANVAPESMIPPASQSMIVADFLGEGVAISVGHRALRINQAMREIAAEYGCVVIDAERFWFEALQKLQGSSGNAAGAEGALFNPGETVHPNLLGHQLSYQAAISEYMKSLAWQSSQPSYSPRHYGYYKFNLGEALPGAVVEIGTPYPDLATPPLKVWARSGLNDVNGIRVEEQALVVDPATGDLVIGDLSASNGGWRIGVTRSVDHVQTDHLYRVGKAYGVTFTEVVEGAVNIQVSTPYITRRAFPANSAGELLIIGENTGIGSSPQVSKYRWKTSGTTISIVADGADIGSAVFTVAPAGLTLAISAIADNTNFQVRWMAMGT